MISNKKSSVTQPRTPKVPTYPAKRRTTYVDDDLRGLAKTIDPDKLDSYADSHDFDVEPQTEVEQIIPQYQSHQSATVKKPAKKALKPARQRPKNYYALQLMATHSLSGAQRFIRTHQLGPAARYQKVQRQGKDWYIVITGHYATHAQAARALKALPASLRNLHPWVRAINKR